MDIYMHIAQVRINGKWVEVWRQPATAAYKPYRPMNHRPWRMVNADTGKVEETGGQR